MARFNEILVGRYNRFLQKFLSMKGPPPAPQLASELSATWALFHGRENRYLEEWRTWGARAVQAGVVAQDTVVRFINPLTSGVICVIESLIIETDNVDIVVVEQAVTPSAVADLANTFTALGFDSRSQPSGIGTGGAAGRLSSTNNIGQGARVIWAEIKTVANGQVPDLVVHEDQEFTVLPGIDFQVRESTLNTSMRVMVRWRERPLDEAERA